MPGRSVLNGRPGIGRTMRDHDRTHAPRQWRLADGSARCSGARCPLSSRGSGDRGYRGALSHLCRFRSDCRSVRIDRAGYTASRNPGHLGDQRVSGGKTATAPRDEDCREQRSSGGESAKHGGRASPDEVRGGLSGSLTRHCRPDAGVQRRRRNRRRRLPQHVGGALHAAEGGVAGSADKDVALEPVALGRGQFVINVCRGQFEAFLAGDLSDRLRSSARARDALVQTLGRLRAPDGGQHTLNVGLAGMQGQALRLVTNR